MGTYLVTGVAGFIGSAVAASLLKSGHTVIGVDNLTTGFIENIPRGVLFFKGGCEEEETYTKLLPKEKYNAFFHIAGQSSGEISFDDPVYDLRTNTESVLHLLKFAGDTGCDRFIYTSSMSVYGVQPDEPVSEKAHPNPESFYAVGKLASEHYLRIYGQRGIRSTALRLFNVYGPGQNMDNLRQGMVSIFMAMMFKNRHIHVKGSPSRYRDFIYIDDVVAAFLACLDRPESVGKIINIGSGIKTQVGALVEKLQKLSPEPITIEYSGTTSGDIFGIYADCSDAAKYLGFEAEVELDEGLARMYTRCREALR